MSYRVIVLMCVVVGAIGGAKGANPEAELGLIEAAISGNGNYVNLILAHFNVDINCARSVPKFNRGSLRPVTPLLMAVYYGHHEIVALLASYPTLDINKEDPSGSGGTALHLAARFGNTDVVQALLDRNDIKINTVAGPDNYTPMMIAAKYNHLPVVRMLQKKGADVDPMSDIVLKFGDLKEPFVDPAQLHMYWDILRELAADHDASMASVNDDDAHQVDNDFDWEAFFADYEHGGDGKDDGSAEDPDAKQLSKHASLEV